MEKKQIILPEKRYVKAPIQDEVVRVGLETSEELLREGDRSIILDLEELFSDERNESKNYKIYGKIKMVFRNMYRGEAVYPNLQDYLYLHGDGGSTNDWSGYLAYDEFAFIRRDTYKQDIDIPVVSGSTYGTYNHNQLTTVPTRPVNKHQSISNMNAPYHNWNLYLSYVYSGDTTFPMKYTLSGATKVEGTNIKTFVSGDGIPCRVESKTGYYKLISPIKHGVNNGEFVIISGKTYSVSSLGDDKYDSENYVINLNKAGFSGVTLPGVITIKRCIDERNITGTTSTYYVHKHKTLTKSTDYILDKAGFESTIFEEEKKLLFESFDGHNDLLVERNRMESLIFDFKDYFILTGLTNNLGYTPSDVYVTTIFRNGSGYFEYPPKNGYKFHLHNEWADNHFAQTTGITDSSMTKSSWTVSGTTFYSGNSLSVGSILTGAFVEYNPSELKERIISESIHKLEIPTNIFNHEQAQTVTGFTGSTSTNKMGLYYYPHNRIKLRQLSGYIETSSTTNIADLPDNARYFPDQGLWKWRDVFDHGYIDEDGNGTDYPFVNNQHYVKTDINFYFGNEREYNNKTDGFKGFSDVNC